MRRMHYWIVLLAAVTSTVASGQVYTAGTTYLTEQHVGSTGRMVSVTGVGVAHIVWTNAVNTAQTNVHVYYNIWDPLPPGFMFQAGVQVDISLKAANATQSTSPDGFCYPAFTTQITAGGPFYVAAAIDFLPSVGAFSMSVAEILVDDVGRDVICLWPKVARTADNDLHVVSREYVNDSLLTNRLYYSRGEPVFDVGFGTDIDWQGVDGTDEFRQIDTSNTYSHVIAASETGNRVAIAWLRMPWFDNGDVHSNDLYLIVSEDGGNTWGAAENLTSFILPDTFAYCLGADFACCNRDTLRGFEQVDILFDDDNNIQLAFTTAAYYQWNTNQDRLIRRDRAMLWHWDEVSGGFHRMAEYWEEGEENTDVGLNNRAAMVEHPSLSLDPESGYLYCSYLEYDPEAHLPDQDLLSADVFLSRSTDGGLHWSEGVNITDTPPGGGLLYSEQDPSAAERLTFGMMHLEYLLRQAGEDAVTPASSIIYQQIEVDEVAFGGVLPERALHVATPECETVGEPIITLNSVSEDFCDSVVVEFSVLTEWGISQAYILRDGAQIGETPAAFGANSWTDYDPLESAEYTVRGWSVECRETDESVPMTGTARMSPDRVTGIAASSNHWRCVTVLWNNLEDETVAEYNIYRDQEMIGSVPPGPGGYLDCDAGLITDMDYLYAVTAVNACGQGENSETAFGRIIGINDGHAALTLETFGPPDWEYNLWWIDGCVSTLVIRDLCPGTTGYAASADWTSTNFGDSVVFETTASPLWAGEPILTGFRLSNDDPDCVGEGGWSAGNSEGSITGPLPTESAVEIPDAYLLTVYPNPFNAEATIRFDLPISGQVNISLFNLLGQEIDKIASGDFHAGSHSIHLDAANLATGVYLIRIEAREFVQTQKIVLAR